MKKMTFMWIVSLLICKYSETLAMKWYLTQGGYFVTTQVFICTNLKVERVKIKIHTQGA